MSTVIPTATPASATRRPSWSALGLSGLGALFALGLSQAVLAEGGLALIAMATLSAALVGLPVALASSRTPVAPDQPAGAALHGMVEVWTVVAVAAAIAPMVGRLGLTGLILAALAWATAHFAPGVRRTAGAVLVILGAMLAVVLIATSAGTGPGWSLLEPRWWPWQPWVGLGLVGGLVIAGAGLGANEGSGRLPRGWAAAAGVGLLALLAAALRVAAPFEAGILDGAMDPGMLLLCIALAPAAVVATGRGSQRRATPAVIGLVATAVFAGPAASALPLWWTAVLPIGLASILALRAWLGQPRASLDRILLVGGAVVALAVPFLFSPSLPDPVAAALLGLAPVAVVWVAGSRALLLREVRS